jgi:hypothetical protein
MGLEFINRVIRTSLILAAVVLVFGSVYYDWRHAVGVSSGLVFGSVNLWFLMGLIKNTITPQPRRPLPILIISVVKFPVLYFVGYLLLRSGVAPVPSYVIGFTMLFAVILLKVLGRQLVDSSWMRVAEGRKGASQ